MQNQKRLKIKYILAWLTLLPLMAAGCSARTASPASQASPASPASPAGRTPRVTEATPSRTPRPTLTPTPAAASGNVALDFVHMIDAQQGWGLSQDTVWKTADGGTSWTNVTPPGIETVFAAIPTQGSSSFKISGAFWDAQTAWIAAAGLDKITILYTVDGGGTWKTSEISVSAQQTYPIQITSFTFLNSQTGWLLRSTNTATGSEYVELYQTQDGGTTWHLVVGANPASTDGTITSVGIKTGIGFRDASNGWLAGSSTGNAVFLYWTQDAGLTWNLEQLAIPSGYTAIGSSANSLPPTFFDDQNGILPVYLGGAAPGMNLFFYRTGDGGKTWLPTTPLLSSSNIFVWDWPDASHGFAAIDGTNTLNVTKDGGKTWSPINIDGVNFHQLDFISPTTGWAILDNGTLGQTVDGGNTWKVIAK